MIGKSGADSGFPVKKPELLAPAGNMAKLKTAFLYGADAVYLGGERFGLRAQADNFSFDEIQEAVRLAETLKKKIYVTVNIVSRNRDLDFVVPYVKKLSEIGVHGVIVSDIGTFFMIREAVPEMPVHVSTQANNLNWRTVQFWLDHGAVRVNLARELSFDEIAEIHAKLAENMGEAYTGRRTPVLEAFVHGAMCMSFSGRCMLSDYMAGRSSNRGDCAQPCRWNYHLAEEQRPGEYMPVFEDDRGTFIFNSKDLCMIEYLPEFLRCGVGSLKIEGRMKSEFYTAVTVRAYRVAIDACVKDPAAYAVNTELKQQLLSELCAVSHRDYSTGFYLGGRGEQIYKSSSYVRDTDFIGVAEKSGVLPGETGEVFFTDIRLRGAFQEGDILEFVMPDCDEIKTVCVKRMENENGEAILRAANAMMTVRIFPMFPVPEGSVVRRRKNV